MEETDCAIWRTAAAKHHDVTTTKHEETKENTEGE
jgi:hypothetical protein